MHSIKGCESESFYYNAILDWNNLPDSIKSISNRKTFKRSIKRHLLTAGQSQETDIVSSMFLLKIMINAMILISIS